MQSTLVQGVNYSRNLNTSLLRSSSPILFNVGDTLDVSNTGLSNKILDYIFDKIEFGVLPGRLNVDNYLLLIMAMKTFQMNYIDILRDFRSIISKFEAHGFARIVYLILDNNLNPNLNKNDLKFIPVTNPFEKYILDGSNSTYLNFAYFSTAGTLSRYSSLMPWHLTNVRDVMMKEIPNATKITDLTAHIGVDSVNFSLIFPNANIISIEIDPEIFLLLRDNLLRYCILNKRYPSTLKAYNNDATLVLNHPMVINSDVVYVDPPWGGENYVQEDKIKLKLGEMKIEDIVRQLLQNGVPTIILKGPVNLYTEELYTISPNIKRYEIKTKPQGGKISYLLFVIRF